MSNRTKPELDDQFDSDFLLSMQTNPVVIAQLQVWEMVKKTPAWPPESLLRMKQIAKSMHDCLDLICPSVTEYQYVIDDGEEDEEEDEASE